MSDIAAYGGIRPYAGEPHTDALLQGVSGLIASNGVQCATPRAIQLQIIEAMRAMFAAAGVQAALRSRSRDVLAVRTQAADGWLVLCTTTDDQWQRPAAS